MIKNMRRNRWVYNKNYKGATKKKSRHTRLHFQEIKTFFLLSKIAKEFLIEQHFLQKNQNQKYEKNQTLISLSIYR